MRHILTYCAIIFGGVFASAQNLVPNPSFENYSLCPTWLAQIGLADDWDNIGIHGGTPDYFNVCGLAGIASVPANSFGPQAANTGDAYVGISLYGGLDYREYIECTLITPMVAGQEYCVSLYVNNAEISSFTSDNALEIALTPTQLTGFGPSINLGIAPQLQNATAIADKNNWVQLVFTYVATGGETYMTLGNFKNNAATNAVPDPSGTDPSSYLFIDDVSITPILDPTFAPIAPLCTSDASVNLSALNGGGTWSGTGITDAVNGTFDPATAGPGTHSISYTLPGNCPQVHMENITVSDCALPVELLNFNAVADGPDRVRLSWTTITEIDNDYFVIERSPDALNFTPIQTVDGAGNTTQQQNYVDFDEDPYRGINYYRLRQVDFDGTTDYSDIRSVVFDDLTFMNLFPNPADNEINATVMLDQDDDLYMQILDATGRVVLQEEYFVLEGMSTIKVDINSLASGVYTFRINTTDENHLSKEFIRN